MPKQRSPRLSAFELFTRLNDAVSAEYWQDACKAGVITSKISHDPPLYYAAIARYYAHHSNKQLIVTAQSSSLAAALRDVAKEWLAMVRKPPKENLLDRLADCFSGTEQAVVNQARR